MYPTPFERFRATLIIVNETKFYNLEYLQIFSINPPNYIEKSICENKYFWSLEKLINWLSNLKFQKTKIKRLKDKFILNQS